MEGVRARQALGHAEPCPSEGPGAPAPPVPRRRRPRRELSPGHLREVGARLGGPVRRQSAPGLRPGLRLGSGRSLSRPAGLRHDGRSDERIRRRDGRGRRPADAPLVPDGRHDRRAVGDDRRSGGPASPRSRLRTRPGDRRLALRAAPVGAGPGRRRIRSRRNRGGAPRQQLREREPARDLPDARGQVGGAVGLDARLGGRPLRGAGPRQPPDGPPLRHQRRARRPQRPGGRGAHARHRLPDARRDGAALRDGEPHRLSRL